jgi:putative hemolysin
MLPGVNPSLESPPGEAAALPAHPAGPYEVGLARDADEVRRAQRLRFEVFNLERGEGLAASYATGLDRDAFDAFCDHLVVRHRASGEVAGTYRLQTGAAAAAGRGYYSEQEFEFAALEPLRLQIVEIGRACVHPRHRNPFALGLLWKGIGAYAQGRRARYLVGCSSLPTLDPGAGWSVYHHLCPAHLAPEGLRTRPRRGQECPLAELPESPAPIPKLMQAYLGLGARICGAPARDAEFGTIDFLTLLDLQALPLAARRRFLP